MESSFLIWNTQPYLFKFSGIELRFYSLFFLVGFTYGFLFMKNVFIRENKNVEDSEHILTAMILGTIIGARLGHCLFYEPEFYLSNPLKILMIWKGGLASHGGTLGIFVALYLYSKKRPDQPYVWVMDRIAVPTALTGCFIRLGNFFNSEILGHPSDMPWAIVFQKVDSIPRHPVMLYEALIYFLTWIFLHFHYNKMGEKSPQGFMLGVFMIVVFGSRIFNEFFKLKQASFMEGLNFSMGQVLSIPFIVFGILLIKYSKKNQHLVK